MAITLLPKEQEEKQARLYRRIIRAATVGVSFYIIFLVLLGAFSFYLSRQLSLLNSSKTSLSSQMQKFSDLEGSIVLLKDRLSTLLLLQNTGKNFRSGLDVADALTGERSDIVINDVSTQEDQVKITITTSDTFSLENFIENVSKNTSLSLANFESITRSSDGSYVSGLTLKLK